VRAIRLSEVFKKHEVVSLIGQPRAHVLTLRKGNGLCDTFFTPAELVLVSAGNGV
jgi:hypothetical protein